MLLINYDTETFNPYQPPPYSVRVKYGRRDREMLDRRIRDENRKTFKRHIIQAYSELGLYPKVTGKSLISIPHGNYFSWYLSISQIC